MTTKPIIELKSIAIHATLSEETPCYTAKLFVDGKHFADVSNHGHGGCDNYHFAAGKGYDDLKALDELIAATYPRHEDYDFAESLECLCHVLAFQEIEKKNFRSMLSRKVVMMEEGKFYTLKAKKTPAMVEAAAAKYGRENILNCLPFEDAFKLYTAAA